MVKGKCLHQILKAKRKKKKEKTLTFLHWSSATNISTKHLRSSQTFFSKFVFFEEDSQQIYKAICDTNFFPEGLMADDAKQIQSVLDNRALLGNGSGRGSRRQDNLAHALAQWASLHGFCGFIAANSCKQYLFCSNEIYWLRKKKLA